jgi:hypothetical protein
VLNLKDILNKAFYQREMVKLVFKVGVVGKHFYKYNKTFCLEIIILLVFLFVTLMLLFVFYNEQ